jgi:hypothetical protein
LSLLLSGAAGEIYELPAWNADQIRSVEGAVVEKGTDEGARIRVQLPAGAAEVEPQATVVFHFAR